MNYTQIALGSLLGLTMLVMAFLREKTFIDKVNESNQKINFYAVGAHCQNGSVESRNSVLTCGSKCLPLYTHRR